MLAKAKGIRLSHPHWVPMHCLVTGADGFLGSHLVEALVKWDQCDHVTAMVHRFPVKWLSDRRSLGKVTVVQGDVRRSSSLVHLPDADVVYHLAGIASAGRCENAPEAARLVNFQGTINMLNQALEMRTKPLFVFASTAALYGEPQYLPVDERHPVEPKSSYTYTKMSSEITVTAYFKDQGLPMVIVRPFNVYGPRQSEDFVVPTIINQVLQGVQLRMGDGRPVRNFTYVADAAQFFLLLARSPDAVGTVINLGSRETISIEGVVHMVLDKLHSDLDPYYDVAKFREGDPTVLQMDPGLAESLLGWRPTVPLSEGLDMTIGHFKGAWDAKMVDSAKTLYSSY
jgi:nucleoside-diphosphate-sugar epimerase